MRRRRGVALATALMLLALVLVIGLALASTSMMSLNLARQSYQDIRCSYRARSGVNELVARLQQREGDRTIQLFNPRPLDLAQEFAGEVQLVDGCWVTFSRAREGYSTDNLTGEGPAAGWLDHGSSSKSIPPYTLELILKASDGSYVRYYRALVRRVWPYAIYSGGGPVVLSGDPGAPPDVPPGSSRVTGSVYARLEEGMQRNPPSHYDPRTLLFEAVTAALTPLTDYLHPVQVGPPVEWNPAAGEVAGVPRAGRPPEEPALYYINSAGLAAGDTQDIDGNRLDGSVDFFHQTGGSSSVEVYAGNQWQGRLRTLVAGAGMPNLAIPDTTGYTPFDPKLRVWRPYGAHSASNKWAGVGLAVHTVSEAAPPGYRWDPNMLPAWILRGPHHWQGTTQNPGLVYIRGNLANRVVCDGFESIVEGYSGPIPVSEYPLDLKLTDCVLHVKGDVDFSNLTGQDPEIKGVTGNGATLIVEGKLSLTGAQLRAGDRGMVIFARDIFLAGECDFKGLLVASGSLTMVPSPGKQFKIRGGILAGGSTATGVPGVTLVNADVQFDPRYLKSLNGFGEYRLTAWEPH